MADDQFWRDLAEAKWGSMVQELKFQADKQHLSLTRCSDARSDTTAPHVPDEGELTDAAVTNAHAHTSSWMKYCCKRMCLKSIR